MEFWNRLTAWAKARNANIPRAFDQFSPTLRGLASDSDGFMESATLKLNVRLPLGVSVAAADEALRALLDEAQLTLFAARIRPPGLAVREKLSAGARPT